MSQVPSTEPGDPLAGLPRVSRVQLRREAVVRGEALRRRVGVALDWLRDALGDELDPGQPDVTEALSGLQRPGLIAQFLSPERGLTFGVHLETALAHALVDGLLGFTRRPGEDRLQITPVEWGILTYTVVRCLDAFLEAGNGGADVVLDRVGPDAFRPDPQREYVTIRWPLRIGTTRGLLRAWWPAVVLATGAAEPVKDPHDLADPDLLDRFGSLGSTWRAVLGSTTLARGVSRLRVGGVLPLDRTDGAASGAGETRLVEVVLDTIDGRFVIPARLSSLPLASTVTAAGPARREARPREPHPMSRAGDSSKSIDPVGPAPDVPVTLTVEIGRVSLPLHRLADLKPGDVLELGRHSREPVELTSNGRLVARGELIQIDTELGVRITNVLL